MADFKTHVTTSTVLGCGYAWLGHIHGGMLIDTAIVGGALCGFAGMLPDLDSDYGKPLRETMCFTAAIVPMMLVDRLQSLDLRYDQLVLVAVSLYFFIRFGVTNMIRKYTVHRGMFHSIPAGLIFAGAAFLICGATNLDTRYYKAGAVFVGFMSHLLLDEIYSIEWKSGRWRLKKSFGTALKLWGNDLWANFSTYAKLVVVGALIIGEPGVMQRLEERNPEFAERYRQLQGRWASATDSLSPEQSDWRKRLTNPLARWFSSESSDATYVEPPPSDSAATVRSPFGFQGDGTQPAPNTYGPQQSQHSISQVPHPNGGSPDAFYRRPAPATIGVPPQADDEQPPRYDQAQWPAWPANQ